jgi:predicted permease
VEVDDELAFHLEQRIQDYVAQGMSPEAARAKALARFGDVQGVKSECTELLKAERRAQKRRGWLEDLAQDLRYGVRSSLRAPLFTLLAVATLALGIGANAAVFGVVKSVLLNPLPFAQSERLVRVYASATDGSLQRSGLSAGSAVDVTERARSLSQAAYFANGTYDIAYAAEGGPQVVTSAFVGGRFFDTLGARAQLGRTLQEADAAPGAPPVVVLSHEAWQRDFGGDPNVLGKSVRMDGDPTEVVGVLRPGFVGPMGKAGYWFPLGLSDSLADPARARGSHWLGFIGRLAPGVSVEAASREVADISAQLAREHPGSDAGRAYLAVPMRDDMVGETRTPLLVLMASAGLVLLITCANLAGALLSRTLTRRKEFSVRLALGAGRGRLVRQLLAESLLLALVGGGLGILLAQGGLAVVRELALTALPEYAELSLDPGALAFTSLLALGTGLAFGLAPALSVTSQNLQAELRDDARTSSESRRSRHLRGTLVAGQIALCLSLLVGAGLLVRSLWAMTSAPAGFHPEGVLTVKVQVPSNGYPDMPARIRFFGQLEERLRTIPGLKNVASTSSLPLPSMNRNGLDIEGVEWPASTGAPFIHAMSVSDDFFRTLGIPLLRGRTFNAFDRPDGIKVFVISEAMARKYWPKGSAIGARVRMGPREGNAWGEVVGIVADVRNDPAQPQPVPMAFASSRQEAFSARTLLLRAQQGEPRALLPSVRKELAVLDASIPLREAAMMEDVLGEQLAGRKLPVVLMTAFGVLALVLAAVGVYAMFASMAAARQREFGIRVALGSSPRGIAQLVLRQGAVWMAVGLAGGALGVIVVTRLLGDLLYGVKPFDPVALGVAVLLLLVCATVALLVPVRRAARVDPLSVLH